MVAGTKEEEQEEEEEDHQEDQEDFHFLAQSRFLRMVLLLLLPHPQEKKRILQDLSLEILWLVLLEREGGRWGERVGRSVSNLREL